MELNGLNTVCRPLPGQQPCETLRHVGLARARRPLQDKVLLALQELDEALDLVGGQEQILTRMLQDISASVRWRVRRGRSVLALVWSRCPPDGALRIKAIAQGDRPATAVPNEIVQES